MIGKYNIKIWNKKIHYTLEINRGISIINGDSGTGKTTFFELVSDFNDGDKGVKSNIKNIKALSPKDNWVDVIKNSSNIIFVIDENSKYIYTRHFANVVQNSDNYFIIITRNPLSCLTYSVNSIYKFVSYIDKITYTELNYKYSNTDIKIKPDEVICEDSNSGFEFFGNMLNIPVISARGKDNLVKFIDKTKMQYIIADNSGFGSSIEKIYRYLDKRTILYLPESFEFLILNYPKFKVGIQDKLSNTCNYCDTKLYKSYERFYTSLLDKLLQSKFNIEYNKSKLPDILKTKALYDFVFYSIKDLDDTVRKG